MPAGENDGPFGAVVLTSTLIAIGHQVEVSTDPECARPTEGLPKLSKGAAAVGILAMNDKAQQRGISDAYGAVIALERFGANINGFRTRTDIFLDTARALGKPTVGIGEGDNEAGFGGIHDTTVLVMPHGAKLATTVAADFVFPATNANWGSYAVEAALACLLGEAALMHSPATEDRVLRRCFEAGVLEAMAFSAEYLVDGLEGETSAAVVQILGNIVRKHLERPRGYAGRPL